MSKFIELHYDRNHPFILNTRFIKDVADGMDGTCVRYIAGKSVMSLLVKESYEDIKRQLIGGRHEDSNSEVANE